MFGITTGYKWWGIDASLEARDKASCWVDERIAKRYPTEQGAKSMATRIGRTLGVLCVAKEFPEAKHDGDIEGLIEE